MKTIYERHGLSKTLEYRNWQSMKNRCYNKKINNYRNYGGSGITICKEWRCNFMKFFSDMGKRPKGMNSIDRIDNSKGYFKENCRWANAKIQGENRCNSIRIEYKSKIYSLVELSEKYSIKKQTLIKRINLGWSIKDAIEKKAYDFVVKIKYRNKIYTSYEIGEMIGYSSYYIRRKIRMGVDIIKFIDSKLNEKI